mmetsp:Transcript_32486/g.52624  ORF Transcript_32486/g.52624 Transcript_32486/m.52624 type:complete len:212 (-) Transcript_32486:1559-2194(-)
MHVTGNAIGVRTKKRHGNCFRQTPCSKVARRRAHLVVTNVEKREREVLKQVQANQTLQQSTPSTINDTSISIFCIFVLSVSASCTRVLLCTVRCRYRPAPVGVLSSPVLHISLMPIGCDRTLTLGLKGSTLTLTLGVERISQTQVSIRQKIKQHLQTIQISAHPLPCLRECKPSSPRCLYPTTRTRAPTPIVSFNKTHRRYETPFAKYHYA